METTAIAQTSIKRIVNSCSTFTEDQLAIEEPLEIQLAYALGEEYVMKNISVTMRTPGEDKALAIGFLFTEGIIKHAAEIEQVNQSVLGCNRILVTLAQGTRPLLQQTDRNFYTTSSCGICGKTSIEAIKTVAPFPITTDDIQVDAATICALPDFLRQQQLLFEHTGGLHASALFDLQGNFMFLKEDVGRHNALDKVIGHAFLSNDLPLDNCILLLSGRASFELIQKASMAGIKIVAAIGAPSSLAVDLAREAGITLIGFVRNQQCNIYSGEQRISSYA
jgi:FdhD protein